MGMIDPIEDIAKVGLIMHPQGTMKHAYSEATPCNRIKVLLLYVVDLEQIDLKIELHFILKHTVMP